MQSGVSRKQLCVTATVVATVIIIQDMNQEMHCRHAKCS